eukprot:jgi/Psemu1/295003/fgenesh1_pm.41_\
MSFVDPLWEFVLEDYEEEDNSVRSQKGSGKRGSSSKGGTLFNRFGSDGGQDESRKYESRDGRDDNNVSTRWGSNKKTLSRNRSMESKSSTGSWGLKSKKASSKSTRKEKRTEYRDDGEDGFWDVITGAPPAATIPKKSSSKYTANKNSKNHGLLIKKTASESSKNSSYKGSESKYSGNNRSKSLVTSSSRSEKSNKGFKNRFRRSQSPKSLRGNSMEQSASRPIVTTTSLKGSPEKKKSSKDEGFDPVDLLFQIADSFDPWGADASDVSYSECESLDGTATVGDEVDGENSIIENIRGTESQRYPRSYNASPEGRSGVKLGSLLDQRLPDRTSIDPKRHPYHSTKSTTDESAVSTEIRLKVRPGGNTISEDVFNKHQNNDRRNIERFEPLRSNFDENSSATSRPSFDATVDSNNSTDVVVQRHYSKNMTEEQGAIEENKRNAGKVGSKFTSNDMKVPRNVHIANGPATRDDGINQDFEGTKRCSLWKKASCGSKKNRNSDSPNRLRESGAAEAFPTSRIIINGEIHSIVGPESDSINKVMGSSSKNLAQSKALPSVFAYDYESNENMDVSYKKTSQRPRNSISVRKLGKPPPLPLVGEDIVMQVEASTVSETDCIIRQGLWWHNSRPSFPNTPGMDVVGKVYSIKQKVGKAYSLKQMQTVVSLVKWGGNARFMTIHPNQLVKVPYELDPAQVACLPECYLSAFQVLHIGQTGSHRYSEKSLKGKSVLILGCMTNNMGKAMIELALHAGVANIYATAKKKHWKTLISYGVMPLSSDPMEYIHRIAGTIDLVLAPNGNLREDVSPVHFRALLPKIGQLIISGHRVNGNDIPINDWRQNHQVPTLACGKNKALQKILGNCATYDVYEEWEKNLDLCKQDLSHLLKLLEKKVIEPEVLDRISLNKVAKAHDLIETKRLPGFLVCEPWMKTKKRAVYL